MSLKKIADKYGSSCYIISKLFKKYSLKIKKPEDYRKYNVDDHYFDIIDTEEKAYWLGFLYADGCVSKDKNHICLRLARKDAIHVEKFKNAIHAENPIHYGEVKADNMRGISEYANIVVSSKIMKEALIKDGCVPQKTFILTYPSEKIIPKELQRHFIRGIFDGDGCIVYGIKNDGIHNYVQFSVAGTLSIVTGIANTLFNNGIIEYYPSINKMKSIYVVSIHGKYNAMKVMEYLYKDSTIYLERKYNKFSEIKNLNMNGDYYRRYIGNKVCYICGDENSIRYTTWHKDGEYNGKVLCNKHYEQLVKIGHICDYVPYSKPIIYCINNGMIFNTKKEAAEWCGLKQSHGITLCLQGDQVTSGKDPITGEALRWAEYNENVIYEKADNPFDYFDLYERIKERPIYQIDIQTDSIIQTFKSSCEAGRYLGKKNFSNITSVCKGRRKTAFGYKWSYVDNYNVKNIA